MTCIDFMKSGGIHIKEKNRGKFTESAHEAGKSVQEHATDILNDPNATRLQKRRAQFAKNAKKWNRENGGLLHAQSGAIITSNYTKAQQKEYLDESLFPDPEEETTDETPTDQTTEPGSESTEGSDPTAWINEYISKLTTPDSNVPVEPTQSPLTTGTTTVSSSPTLTATQATYKEIVDYLMSKGLSKAGAAGAAGVFMAESGLTAGKLNKDEDARYGSTAGRGIGQWSNKRRQQYDNFMKGKDITLQNDLDFFLYDLNSRPLVKDILTSTSSVEEAVKAMHLGYENGSASAMSTPEQMTRTYSRAWARLGYRPYSYQDSHNKRLNYAQQAFNV